MRVDVYTRHDAFIKTIAGDELLGFVHTDELNGSDSVEITTRFRLCEGYRLIWKDRLGKVHEHVCQDPQDTRAADGSIVCTDTALNSICELMGDYIDDKRPYGYSFRRALEVCLEPTRWQVGTVDQAGTVSSGLTFYHTDCRSALNAILECGGELETEVSVSASGAITRKVGIGQHRGDADGHRRFEYGKDLSSISRTEHWGAITACYGYGKGLETESGGYGRKLTFGDINGGKDYVADATALTKYGRPDGKGGFCHVFGKYENSQCEDASQLKSETQAYLDAHKEPGVTYEADVIDLVAMGRAWEGVGVGDDVQIVDTCFDPVLRCQGRVSKLVTNLLNNACEVTLGNVTETLSDIWERQQSQIAGLQQNAANWDVVAGTPGAYLQQIIDGLNQQFNTQGMSYCFTSFEQGTIWSSVPLDDQGRPTKTGGSAIQVCSQGFRIASGTKSDGSYDWRTFGTGQGFTADEITTGTLNAGLVKSGTLLVGTSANPVLRADFDAKTVELQGSCVTIGAGGNVDDAIEELGGEVDAANAVFGVCSTSGSTQVKTVSIPGFKLREGATVSVRFTYANTAANPKLNVSGTGDKWITLKGTYLPTSSFWAANDTVTFVYSGGWWRIADSGALSRITVTENEIELKVSKGDVSSQISVESGQVAIKSNRFLWESTYSEMTRYGQLTAQSMTAKGTFECGSTYGIKLNSSGQLAGFRNGSQVGYIDYSSSMRDVQTQKISYGIQMQCQGSLRISTPKTSMAATSDTSVTATYGETGDFTLHYISKIQSNGDGTITWWNASRSIDFINGFCTYCGFD